MGIKSLHIHSISAVMGIKSLPIHSISDVILLPSLKAAEHDTYF
jgi:hypothetical protein